MSDEEKKTIIEKAVKMSKKIYTIDELKKIIISLYKAEEEIDKIYLFGSYARGEANEDSDIDLYFIYDKNIKSSEEKFKLYCKYRDKIKIYKSVDLFLCSKTEFDKAKKDIYMVENLIVKEGVILYERR